MEERSLVTEDRGKWQKPLFFLTKKNWPGHFFSLQERTSSPEPSQGYPSKPVPSHSLKRRCQPESHVLLQRLQWFQLPQLPPPGTGAEQGQWALRGRTDRSPTLTWKPRQHEVAVAVFCCQSMCWLWCYWLVAWCQPHLMIWWVLNEDQCDWGLGERKKMFGWFYFRKDIQANKPILESRLIKTPLIQPRRGPGLNQAMSQTMSQLKKFSYALHPPMLATDFSALPLQVGLVHSLLSSWRPLHSAQPCTDELQRLCLCWVPVLQVTLHFDHGPHSSHWPSTAKPANEKKTRKWMQVARWCFNKKPGKVYKICQCNYVLYPPRYNDQLELNFQLHYSFFCLLENVLILT